MKKTKKTKPKTKKKEIKKVIKKPTTKSVQSVLTTKVQDTNYWINRPILDKEKDWKYDEPTWIDGYVLSVKHPHRELILETLKKVEPFGALLEVGCSVGPNLVKIEAVYPEKQLAGIDVREELIVKAQELLPKPIFKIGSVLSIPFEDKGFDVVLVDAVLMYIGPKEIEQALSELNRVASKAIILVERLTKKTEMAGHVWGHNYPELLGKLGFQVEVRRLDENSWPDSPNWQKYGAIIVASRPA